MTPFTRFVQSTKNAVTFFNTTQPPKLPVRPDCIRVNDPHWSIVRNSGSEERHTMRVRILLEILRAAIPREGRNGELAALLGVDLTRRQMAIGALLLRLDEEGVEFDPKRPHAILNPRIRLLSDDCGLRGTRSGRPWDRAIRVVRHELETCLGATVEMMPPFFVKTHADISRPLRPSDYADLSTGLYEIPGDLVVAHEDFFRALIVRQLRAFGKTPVEAQTDYWRECIPGWISDLAALDHGDYWLGKRILRCLPDGARVGRWKREGDWFWIGNYTVLHAKDITEDYHYPSSLVWQIVCDSTKGPYWMRGGATGGSGRLPAPKYVYMDLSRDSTVTEVSTAAILSTPQAHTVVEPVYASPRSAHE